MVDWIVIGMEWSDWIVIGMEWSDWIVVGLEWSDWMLWKLKAADWFMLDEDCGMTGRLSDRLDADYDLSKEDMGLILIYSNMGLKKCFASDILSRTAKMIRNKRCAQII